MGIQLAEMSDDEIEEFFNEFMRIDNQDMPPCAAICTAWQPAGIEQPCLSVAAENLSFEFDREFARHHTG